MNLSNIQNYRAAEKHLWDHYGLTSAEHFVHLPKFGTRMRVLESDHLANYILLQMPPRAPGRPACD